MLGFPSSIGVARVLRLGGKCQLMSTYSLSKIENSSDLVHYFWDGSQIHIKKMLYLEGPMPGLKDLKGPCSFTEGLPD